MKKSNFIQAFCAFITLCLCASINAQTIRRCNNLPGVSGVNVYTTLQAAHDAAVAGDIIYVEPSATSYGSVDIRKRLTIIGNGYYLDKNSNVSFETRTSNIDNITFNNGSANSIITGVVVFFSSIAVNDVNVTITRCTVDRLITFGLSSNLVAGQNSRGNNGTITKCILRVGVSGRNSPTVANQYGYNCTITNNMGSFRVGDMTNSVISNNTFNTAAISVSTADLYGCSITNNIYDARGLTGTIPFVFGVSSGNTISNNICLSLAATPTGNGNVNFGDETITFLVSNPWTTLK